jgi:hypothetical protein
MRRRVGFLAVVAAVALLCSAPAVATERSKLAAKRAHVTACAAIKKEAVRKRCVRPRAAFRVRRGRGVARLAGTGTLAGGSGAASNPAAGGGPSLPGVALPDGPVALPVVNSTLGVEAHDFGTFALRLTKTAVPTGNLTIFFRNHDASEHNLWIAPPHAGAQPLQISDAVGQGGGATKTIAVTPGSWRLFCSIEGHSSMTRDLAVG